MKHIIIFLCALTLFALPLSAQEEKAVQDDPKRYSPPGCEFEITFPAAPYTTRRCHPTITDRCELMTSYTKVYDLQSTITFYVTCKPSDDSPYDQFTEDVMRTTLIGRAGTRLETTDMVYDENEKHRMASLIGAGPSKNGKDTLLYVGQLWVGQGSVMTVEGELVGDANPDIDQQFADVLKSIKAVEQPNPEEAE